MPLKKRDTLPKVLRRVSGEASGVTAKLYKSLRKVSGGGTLKDVRAMGHKPTPGRKSSLLTRGGVTQKPNKDHSHSEHNVWVDKPLELWPKDLIKRATFKLTGLRGKVLKPLNDSSVRVQVLGDGRFEAKTRQANGQQLVLQLKAGNLMMPEFNKTDSYSDLDWMNLVSGKGNGERTPVIENESTSSNSRDTSVKSSFAALSLQCRHMVKQIMRQRGCTWQESLDQLFQQFDLDGNGTIDYEEFEGRTSAIIPSLLPQQVRGVFVLLDVDGNGEIDVSEFQRIIDEDDRTHSRDDERDSDLGRSKRPSVRQRQRDRKFTHENERTLPLNQRNYFVGNMSKTTTVLRAQRIRERTTECVQQRRTSRLSHETPVSTIDDGRTDSGKKTILAPLISDEQLMRRLSSCIVSSAKEANKIAMQTHKEQRETVARLYSTGTASTKFNKHLQKQRKDRTSTFRQRGSVTDVLSRWSAALATGKQACTTAKGGSMKMVAC
jgi:hypothetical protein